MTYITYTLHTHYTQLILICRLGQSEGNFTRSLALGSLFSGDNNLNNLNKIRYDSDFRVDHQNSIAYTTLSNRIELSPREKDNNDDIMNVAIPLDKWLIKVGYKI